MVFLMHFGFSLQYIANRNWFVFIQNRAQTNPIKYEETMSVSIKLRVKSENFKNALKPY